MVHMWPRRPHGPMGHVVLMTPCDQVVLLADNVPCTREHPLSHMQGPHTQPPFLDLAGASFVLGFVFVCFC